MDAEDLKLVIDAKKKNVVIAPASGNMFTVYYKGGFAMMTRENIRKSLDKLPDKPWWKFWA